MVMARGGQSRSATSVIAPTAFRASAIKSRMTLALPSRNWIRYCMVKVDQSASQTKEGWRLPFRALVPRVGPISNDGAVGRFAGDRRKNRGPEEGRSLT